LPPKQKDAKLNRKNDSLIIEKIQSPINNIVYKHVPKKTFLRPKIDISRMAGMILNAVPTTIVATGNVDKLFEGASTLPIMPPTNSIKTLSDINSARQAVNIQTFLGRFNIEL
jgi:hypothetical protein